MFENGSFSCREIILIVIRKGIKKISCEIELINTQVARALHE
jgi:hypothetical protein